MKKLMSMLVLAAMLAATMASCGGDDTETTTTAAPTTTTVVTTTQAAPPTTNPTDTDPREVIETPMVAGAGLEELLAGKTSLTATNKIDMETLAAIGFSTWSEANENIDRMFDGIDTELEWFYDADENGDLTILKDGADPTNEDGTKRGGGPGKVGGGVSNPTYFYFGLTEGATITAYVLTTGNDNMDWTGRNPVEWTLFGTNDKDLFEACSIDGEEFDETKWTELDYVYDGGIVEANFAGNGYEIDADKQGEFQYYVWKLGYTTSGSFQACELEFYIG